MRRREFVMLLGGAAVAWPLPARAQQASLPRIGIIDNSPQWEPFRQGLRDHGYVEGRTIAFEYRTAEGTPDRLAAAAAELSQLPVNVACATDPFISKRCGLKADTAVLRHEAPYSALQLQPRLDG